MDVAYLDFQRVFDKMSVVLQERKTPSPFPLSLPPLLHSLAFLHTSLPQTPSPFPLSLPPLLPFPHLPPPSIHTSLPQTPSPFPLSLPTVASPSSTLPSLTSLPLRHLHLSLYPSLPSYRSLTFLHPPSDTFTLPSISPSPQTVPSPSSTLPPHLPPSDTTLPSLYPSLPSYRCLTFLHPPFTHLPPSQTPSPFPLSLPPLLPFPHLPPHLPPSDTFTLPSIPPLLPLPHLLPPSLHSPPSLSDTFTFPSQTPSPFPLRHLHLSLSDTFTFPSIPPSPPTVPTPSSTLPPLHRSLTSLQTPSPFPLSLPPLLSFPHLPPPFLHSPPSLSDTFTFPSIPPSRPTIPSPSSTLPPLTSLPLRHLHLSLYPSLPSYRSLTFLHPPSPVPSPSSTLPPFTSLPLRHLHLSLYPSLPPHSLPVPSPSSTLPPPFPHLPPPSLPLRHLHLSLYPSLPSYRSLTFLHTPSPFPHLPPPSLTFLHPPSPIPSPSSTLPPLTSLPLRHLHLSLYPSLPSYRSLTFLHPPSSPPSLHSPPSLRHLHLSLYPSLPSYCSLTFFHPPSPVPSPSSTLPPPSLHSPPSLSDTFTFPSIPPTPPTVPSPSSTLPPLHRSLTFLHPPSTHLPPSDTFTFPSLPPSPPTVPSPFSIFPLRHLSPFLLTQLPPFPLSLHCLSTSLLQPLSILPPASAPSILCLHPPSEEQSRPVPLGDRAGRATSGRSAAEPSRA
ncbi:uncharacterized protein [Narcine bancroftii]|uniref:uncharacterized protein n=1 Tax=Narcine bancroftii TaxID=1343680 RepID=UPI0038317879